MNLNRMTVAKRLQWGFGAILVVLGLVALLSIIEVQAIQKALSENSEANVPIQRHAITLDGNHGGVKFLNVRVVVVEQVRHVQNSMNCES